MKHVHFSYIAAGCGFLAAAGLGACSSDDGGGGPSEPNFGGAGGEGGGASGSAGTGGVVEPPPEGFSCEGACCPTDDACYGAGEVGDECFAQRDNSVDGPNGNRIQLRGVWTRSTAPLGNTVQAVYQVLSNGSALPWPECNQGTGLGGLGTAGGFIQLIDLDLDAGTSTVGYAPWINPDNLQSVISNGLCMIEDAYMGDPAYRLPAAEMSPMDDWPAVMRDNWPTMPLADAPWQVKPTVGTRLDSDFDVESDREQLLQAIADDPDADGVFYYDEATGRSHGFSPLSWIVVYTGSIDNRIAIPIREVETNMRSNDPDERSCIGAFRGDALDETTCNSEDPEDPQWGCPADGCPAGETPATVKGYFLITELDQIFSTVLMQTLCVSYPTQDVAIADGWADPDQWGLNCQGSPQWNPSDPVDGLPQGDWCSATNSPATADCHDAFRSESFQAFQGFNIQDATCGLDGQ